MSSNKPKPIGYSKEKAKLTLEKYDIDVLIATTPQNVFYTSGIPSLHVAPNPILFILYNQFPYITLTKRDGEQCLIDWMVYQSNNRFSWIDDVVGIINPKTAMNAVKDKLENWGCGLAECKIGLETLMPRYQSEFIRENFKGAHIIDADDAFLDMRIIKSEEEIKRIKKSTEIADKTIMKLIDDSKIGMTDNDLLKIARNEIIANNAEGWDHFTIGLGDSDPEAPGTGREIQRNEINRFDIGAIWKGYVSDISRNLIFGKIPDGASDVMDRIKLVHEFCVENVQAGVNAKSLNGKIKKHIKSLSRTARVYVTIHSIGLDCEEVQLISPMRKLDRDFENNMVLDIEVWQNFTGTGLVGIEDCYVIKNNKCERISKLKQDFYIK